MKGWNTHGVGEAFFRLLVRVGAAEGKECVRCGGFFPLHRFHIADKKSGRKRTDCKDCFSETRRIYRKKKMETDPAWAYRERLRNRKKWHDLYADKEYGNKTKAQRRAEWRERYPEKHEAQKASYHIGCKAGHAKHHWSYRLCDWKDVVELTDRDHNLLHTLIEYDQSERLYRNKATGELLTDKADHLHLLAENKK